MQNKIFLKSFIYLSIMCVLPNFSLAKSIVYSLDGILESTKHIGELTVLEKEKIIINSSLDCGYIYKFISSDFDSKTTSFWSAADLNVKSFYFILSTESDIEVLILNEQFKKLPIEERKAIKSDFHECLAYVESRQIVIPSSTVFNMGIINNVKYVKSEYVIINDANIPLVENDYCDIQDFLSSKPIQKDCLEIFLKGALTRKKQSKN